MALTPRSGSSTLPSNPNDSSNTVPTNLPTPLADMPFISDSNLNKFAIDTTQYLNTTKQLVGFMKGKRISVTYYRLLNREGSNNRTQIADSPTLRNIINTEYQKISNLEITLPKGFEFTANNEQSNMSIVGQAQFYPNMNPNIGDLFLMGTGDGRIGICRISQVTPTNWRQDHIYITDFVIQEFLDETNQAVIEGAVTLRSVFSKQNYLGGTAALLSEESYTLLLKIAEVRNNLCRFYHQRFFDPDTCTYIRPDGIYDPFVVQFMANKLTMDVIHVVPKILTGKNPKLYQQTLWARLEDRYNTSLAGLAPCCLLAPYGETRMGVFVTELYGRSIVMPTCDTDGTTPYLYTSAFYTGNTTTMSVEELLVYNVITQRSMGDLNILVTNYLDPVYTLSADQQFYEIPLYIHLIDMAMQSQYREVDAPSMSFASSGDNGDN
jgi:hypothetical protein